jgi:hypothetical protein
MIEQISNAITFYAFYTASGVGKTGIAVTIDIYGLVSGTPIVSAASATELGGGLYYYTLASGSVGSVGEYIAIFKTADATVDQKQLPGIWSVGRAGIENLDGLISTRSTQTSVNSIPTTPLLTGDVRLNNLDATISSRSSHTPADVWTSTTRTLSSFGTLVADIWNNVTRTLTTSAAGVAGEVWAYATRTLTSFAISTSFDVRADPDVIIYKYATDNITITNVVDKAQIWFTVKRSKNQLDSESFIQVTKTGGLIYINGLTAIAAGLTSADASLTIVGNDLKINISAAASALMEDHSALYGEVKTKNAYNEIEIISQFVVSVINAVTRSI